MTLKSIADEIRSCKRCRLHESRQRAVPGEGPRRAPVILIGEAPGREEDRTGRPFTGVSGRTLDQVLDEAGWKRKEIFITSVVKCRPPQNRIPRKDEQNTCVRAHLRRQIEVIKPKIVCLLGGVAGRAFLEIGRIADSRGKLIRRGQISFFLTYHPAAARRNPAWYQSFLHDMTKLHAFLLRASFPMY